MKWKTQIKNPSHENLNQMIVMDFSMVRIGPYFHKSIKGSIWTIFQFFFPHKRMFPQNLHGALLIWTPITPWHMFDQ
jgi:hypothetical protein